MFKAVKSGLIILIVTHSLSNGLAQIPNIDSLMKSCINRVDVDSKFYLELDSFKTMIDLYASLTKPDRLLIDAKQNWAKLNAARDPIKSMIAFEESIEISEQLNYKRAYAIGIHDVGLIFFNEGLYKNALENFHISADLFEKNGEWWYYGFSLVDIGNTYFKLKQFEVASQYYTSAIQVFAKNQFEERYEFALSVCYNNIGLVEMEQKKYTEALAYFKKGLDLRIKANADEYYGHSFRYLADCYFKLNHFDSAFVYFRKAIESDEKIGPKTELVRSHIGLGKFLNHTAKPADAQLQLQKAYQIAVKNKLITVSVEASNALAEFYLVTDNKDSAIRYLKMMLKIAKEYNQVDGREIANEKLLAIAKESEDKDLQIYSLTELLEIERQKQVDEVIKEQLEYEVNKRISDRKMMESSARVQKLIIFSIITILIILAFISIYIFRSRNRFIIIAKALEKKNREFELQTKNLEEANQLLNLNAIEISHQNEEILSQSENLSKALEELKELQRFKEGMAAMIVHDLKNPLNTILNQTKSILIKESAAQMLNMVNNILDLQKYESAKMPVNLKLVMLDQLIGNALFNTRYLTEQKNLSIRNTISERMELHADSELTERIITNLLINAIKYSELNGIIGIRAERTAEKIVKISISDNGQGIPENQIDRVFDRYTQLVGRSSGNIRPTGLGLAFCKLAVESQGGTIGVESIVGKGASFWFTLQIVNSTTYENFGFQNKAMGNISIISKEEYHMIEPLLNEMKLLAVYETAEIHKIIVQIGEKKITNIEKWLEDIERAVYSVNKEEYIALLNRFND